jgi:hypothetical protein
MSSTGQLFPYRPLKEGTSEFRIIHLLQGDWNEPISCILEHESLDDHPLYEALSYTWGGPALVEPIQLSFADSFFEGAREDLCKVLGLEIEIAKGHNKRPNSTLFVTANLVQALRRFRKEHAPRWIWVDGICINQADLRERSQQVQKMRLIYSQALVVTIWLGELQDIAAEEVDLTESNIRSALNYLRGIAERNCREFNDLRTYFENLAKTELPMDPALFRAISSLCHRPWFTRVWVVQEHVVARSATILCGDERIGFEQFLSAMNSVAHLLELQEPSSLSSSTTVIAHGLYRRMFSRPEFLNLPIGERVLRALHLSSHHLHATDPRDKLYSLIGLLGDVSGCQILVADYEKPLNEFWLDLTKFLIHETSSICFLQQPEPGASPSWVAKWEYSPRFHAIDEESGKIHDTVKKHTIVRFSQCGMFLHTKAIALGQVSDYIFIHHNPGQNLAHWRNEMQKLEARLGATPSVLEKYRTKEVIQLALRDMVTMRMEDSLIRDRVQLRERYLMLMGRLPPNPSSSKDNALAANYQSELDRKTLPQTVEVLVLSSGHIGCVKRKEANVTLYGHGVAKVYHFPGAASPFELIQVGDTYRLSRQCYVHGLKHSSIDNMLQTLERNKWEQICLN